MKHPAFQVLRLWHAKQRGVVASGRGAAEPWLMELVAGHLAAKRGELATTRIRLEKAIADRPGDIRVANQAKASLALALAVDWKITPQYEDELARVMNDLDTDFGCFTAVHDGVRSRLAQAYAKANNWVESELLSLSPAPIADGADMSAQNSKWTDVSFIKAMISRVDRRATEFDKFVLQGAPTKSQLEQELALRHLVDGDFAAASQTFKTTTAESRPLGTDPFVTHVVDCHDCDHQAYASAPWTHATLAERLADLQREANKQGERAAEAALALGIALYNITWYGNARSVLGSSHQTTRDTRMAERWFDRAFKRSNSRELKARAAFMAAKGELGRLLNAPPSGQSAYSLPIPKTWFPVVKRFSDTKYYKEVLSECGHFRRWVAATK